MSTLVVGEAMPATKNQASAARLRLLRQIRQLAQTAIYGSMAHIYISVIAEQTEKPPATMFLIMQRLGSVRESRLGLNSRIVRANLPP
jgi:hypothetical protein